MWDKNSLLKILKEKFPDYSFVIASNREPYLHTYSKSGKIKCEHSIGGVTVIFNSIIEKTKGTWVAYGGSAADKATVDKNDHFMVPPNNPKYTLRRIWMTEKERKGYYDGFSNEALWPLCHVVFIGPKFLESDWVEYKKINRRFAEAILEEIKDKKALVWVQDYQLALVAQYIKEKRPDVLVAQFWHIPWPTNEIFRICPWRKEILTGLLHNDVLGFHRYYHVDNFLKNVSKEMEAKVDYEDSTIGFQGRTIKVGAFPISVNYEEIVAKVSSNIDKETLIRKYIKGNYKTLALGVDRLDYTKGIPNRLLAIERFLEKNPDQIGKFVYLGIEAPSRTTLKIYKELRETTDALVNRINKKFSTPTWQPIQVINEIIERNEILQLARFAHLCLVTPLDDGMNLVAKEYVSANRGDGALILSSYIGAAKELTEAFFVNPYDIEEVADTIKLALECPVKEKKERMKTMKKVVEERNVFRWAGKFLQEVAKYK